MCRILLSDKKGFDNLDIDFGMLNELDYLAKQCGGHSQGYILIKDNKIIKIDKGVKLTNKNIYSVISNIDFDYFIYHTRIATVGEINDSNAHPFYNKNKTFALVMNGTEWGTPYELANDMEISDTEFVFKMFNEMNLPTRMLHSFSSRYMGFRDEEVFIKNTKDNSLRFVKYDDGGFVVASSFPFSNNVMKMKNDMWFQGQELIGEELYNKHTNKKWDDDRTWDDVSWIDYRECK